MVFHDDEEKDKDDAELPDEALDDVLGGDGLGDEEEDDPLMAEEAADDEEGRDWA